MSYRYWDWAEARVAIEGLPPVLYTPTVEIITPGGKLKHVENPLATYKFTSIPKGFKNTTDTDVRGENLSLFILDH